MGPEHAFWFFQAKDLLNTGILIATIAAIWLGPIKAVQITRQHDEERADMKAHIVFRSCLFLLTFHLCKAR